MKSVLLIALISGLSLASSPSVPTDMYRPCGLSVKHDRQRPLDPYRQQVAAYSQRHYGENTWQLDPKVIVLHYTAGQSFPWNLINTPDFAGETPGLAVHYVIDGQTIWESLPPQIRSRGAFGINHRAINIELVAADAADLAKRPATLANAAKLTHCLMQTFKIDISKVYSHQQVSKMNKELTPEVLDLLHPEPYHKIDPGEGNFQAILKQIRQLSPKT